MARDKPTAAPSPMVCTKMTDTWHSLLANLAIVAIVVSIWTQLDDPADGLRRSWRTLWLALLLAGGTVAVMASPFQIRPGIFADLRVTMIVLSGFFGGPLIGVVAWLAGVAYRIWVGGVGAPSAVISLTIALAVGMIGRQILAGQTAGKRAVVALAAVAALGSMVGFLFLPAAIRVSLFPGIAPAVATLTFVAIMVAGFTLIGDERRRQTTSENLIYAAVFDALPDPLHAKDLAGRFIAANPATATLMRVKDVKDLIGHDDFDFYPRDVAARFRADEERLMAEGKPFNLRQPVTFLDGSTGMLATLKAPLRDKHGQLVGLITHNRDVTERAQLEEKYAQSQRQLGQALANMADGLAMFDRDARIIVCNPQYAALFPKTTKLRVAGADLYDILRAGVASGEEIVPPGVETEAWIEATCAAIRVSADSEIQLGDGRWLEARVRPSDDGTSLTVISEITAAKKAEAALVEVNARLDALSKTDGLTGLMNRRGFDETLAGEFARSARTGAPISLLMIDVDWFKAFNDTYGHPAGDDALRAISQCLTTTLKRPADVCARYGGEELVALLPDTTAEGAARLGEEFRRAVRNLRIAHTGSEKGCITVSIGIATFDRNGTTSAKELVRHADEALYNAKASGRDRVHEWTAPRVAEPRKAG